MPRLRDPRHRYEGTRPSEGVRPVIAERIKADDGSFVWPLQRIQEKLRLGRVRARGGDPTSQGAGRRGGPARLRARNRCSRASQLEGGRSAASAVCKRPPLDQPHDSEDEDVIFMKWHRALRPSLLSLTAAPTALYREDSTATLSLPTPSTDSSSARLPAADIATVPAKTWWTGSPYLAFTS